LNAIYNYLYCNIIYSLQPVIQGAELYNDMSDEENQAAMSEGGLKRELRKDSTAKS